MNEQPDQTAGATPPEGKPAQGTADVAPEASSARPPSARRVYDLHTAMWDDVESGSIWISAPSITSRSIVRVRNTATHRVVHCEAKMVEDFFLSRFTEQTGQPVQDATKAVFISAWYRKQLGILTKAGQVELEIVAADSFLNRIRACLHHPQVVVRIATILGLWSVVLGVSGLVLGLISLLPSRHNPRSVPSPAAVTPPLESSATPPLGASAP